MARNQDGWGNSGGMAGPVQGQELPKFGSDMMNGPFGQMMAMGMMINRGNIGQQAAASGQAPGNMIASGLEPGAIAPNYVNPNVKPQENLLQAQMTAQNSPPSIATGATNALGVKSLIPSANVAEAGQMATGKAAESFVTGISNADRLINESKTLVSNYKNLLGERIASGKNPYDMGTQFSQDYLTQHPYLRRVAAGNPGQTGGIQTAAVQGYLNAQKAIGGVAGQNFTPGNKNPNYATDLGTELTPPLTSTGPHEDINTIRTLITTAKATEYAMAHGLTTANDMAQVADWKQLGPVVSKAMQNGFDPNSPEIRAQIDDVLKTKAGDPRYQNMKFAGFDYNADIKQHIADELKHYPQNREAALKIYKKETGEDYNG